MKSKGDLLGVTNSRGYICNQNIIPVLNHRNSDINALNYSASVNTVAEGGDRDDEY